jgi:hypothetical protein
LLSFRILSNTLQDSSSESKRYQVYLRSSGGPIGIYLVSKADQAPLGLGTNTPVSTPGLYQNSHNVLMGTPTGIDPNGGISSQFYRDPSTWGFSPDIGTPVRGAPIQIPHLATSYEGTLGEDESLADMY